MRSLFYLFLFLFTLSNLVAGDPDHLEVVVLSENNLCDDSLPNRGAAFAKIIEDDGKEDDKLKDYTINWFVGSSTSGTPIFVGPAYDQMAAGTYTVQAIHDKSSFVDVVEVIIVNTTVGPDAYVDEIKNAKNCKENDGSAKVRVRATFPSQDDDEGDVHSHDNIKDCKHDICWNFVWYEGNNPFIGDVVAVGSDANNLKPGTYAVVVTNEADGCQTVVSLSVGLDAEEPVVEGTVVANITDCDNLTAGSLEAFVSGENSNKYEFDWYIGDFADEAPDFNNQPILTNLSAGNYTVVAREKASGCPSLPLTLTVEDLTSIPVMATTLDLEQTSCDTANPNGAVSATADGVTTGYSFEWFSGQSTTTMIGTGPSITGLAAGFYTVRATNTSDPNSQNCAATAEIEVTENLVDPAPIDATVVDQSYCVNPNGAIAASVNGVTAGYTFYWFNGNIASPDINSPDFTGATYADLVAGDYTLIVENNATLCKTDAQAYTVANLTAKPVVALAASTELTSCAAPNGSFSVTADGGTSGHTFRWYEGVSTAAADEIMTASGASISGLAAGTYTVLVSNTTTGCFDTFEHTVLDQTDTPAPTTTIIDQTQCTPLDGEIQANVGGNTSDYNFYWFNGNVASPDINSPDRTGATISNLPAGEYTLVVEHDASKCASAAQVLTVDDLTPSITGSIALNFAQTSCDPNNPNGALTASETSGSGTYSYRWFIGNDTTTALEDASSVQITTATASGLSAQAYTVLITNDDTGCQDIVSYSVPSDIQKPVISVSSITPNTICDTDLSGNPYTGSIDIAVTYDGAAVDLNDYTLEWYAGSDTTGTADYTSTGGGANIYTAISDGTYTVVVKRTTPGPGYECYSDVVNIVVPDNTVTPTGTISLDAAQTSCDASVPNGALTASATPAATYSYQWYDGADTTAAELVTTASITDLEAKTYTVLITDDATGCQDIVSYTVPSDIQKPVISVSSITPNTICDTDLSGNPYTGSIDIAVTYDGAAVDLNDYTLEWYAGSDTTGTADYTSTGGGANIYTAISDGTYTVVVKRTTPGPGYECYSDVVNIVVPDNTVTPTGTISLDAAQTSCDASVPNGALTASATPAATYSYQWYDGADTTAAELVTTASITDLEAKTYTVLITDDATGCQDIVSYTVPSDIQKPVISVSSITPNTICDTDLSGNPYTGSIDIAVTYDGAAVDLNDYTLEWYAGSDTTGTADYTSTGGGANIYTAISDGTYTVVVKRTTPGPGYECYSDVVNIVVPDNTVTPTGTISLDAAQTSCDASVPNGALTASATPAATYSYQWYDGADTTAAELVTTASITDLEAKTYTVLITDDATGCQDIVSYTVPSDIQKPVISVSSITPNTICDTDLSGNPYTGSIDIAVTYDGAAVDLNDYTLEWYAGSDTTGTADYTSTGGGANIYTAISDGTYTVVVKRTTPGPGYECYSDVVNIVVPDNTVTPTGTISLDAAQTSCDASVPNGALTASATPAATYSYQWYDGADTTAAELVTTASITDLEAKTYTVLITDDATGCQDIVSYTVPSDIQKPVISVSSITPNTICDTDLSGNPYTGSIDIAVTYDGAAVDLNDYTLEWYAGSDTTGTADYTSTGGGANIYTAISDGTYTVVVKRTTPGPGYECYSDVVNIVVPDNTVTPTGTISLDAAQTSCDASVPNGALTASATPAATYSYQWYDGADTTAAELVTTASITGLEAKTYTVLITDDATGCQDIVSYTVPTDLKKPVVNIDPATDITANTVCDDSDSSVDFDGQITASVTYDGVAEVVNDYFFDWYLGTDTTGLSPVFSGIGDNVYNQLPSGDYTVIVTKISPSPSPGLGCSSFPITVNVPDNFSLPVITMNKDALQTSCTSNNGQLTASAGAGSFTYEWFTGIGVTTSFTGTVSGTDGETISGLAAGNYTVRVTNDDTGCQNVQDIYLDENVIQPEVELTIATPFTDCNTDVVIAPSITLGNTAADGYDFIWYEGQDSTGTALTTTNNNGGANPDLSEPNTSEIIYSGYYTVVAEDRFTNCKSAPVTIFVDRPGPQFDIAYEVYLEPAQCTDDDGVITAFIDSNGNGTLDSPAEDPDYSAYTFEWYIGNPIDPNSNYYTDPEPTFTYGPLEVDSLDLVATTSVPPPSNPGVPNYGEESATSGATIYSRLAGRYTVVVTDDITGCKEFIGVDLNYINGAQVSVGDVDVDSTTNCAIPNGRIEVLSLDNLPTSPARTLADYEFNWYQGTNDDTTNIITDGTNAILTPVLNQLNGVSELPAGYYTVVPIETFGSACRLTPYTIFLDSAARQPELTLDNLDNSTSCVGNGTIEVTASSGGGTAGGVNYSYDWYVGDNTSTPFVDGVDGVIGGPDGNIVSGLMPNQYTVVATDDDTDCFIIKTYTIRDRRVVPTLSAVAATRQSFCAPLNGSLTITDADVSPGNVSDYEFSLFLGGTNSSDSLTSISSTGVFSGLEAGEYYVRATRITVGDGQACSSAFFSQTVEESDPVNLNFSTVANTSCLPATNADGEITLTMSTPSTNGTIATSTYAVSFVTAPADFLAGSTLTGVSSGYTFESAAGDNIPPGNYTIEVTNEASGCTASRSFEVADEPEPILFSESDLTIVPQELCKPDGSITVNSSILPGDETEYTFNWYDDGMNSIGNNTNVLDTISYPTLVAGTYYVEAIRLNTVVPGASCSSSLVEFELPSIGRSPSVSLSSTANTSCDPSNYSDATILIEMSTASVTGNTDIDNSDYTLEITDSPTGSGFTGVTVNTATSPYTFISTATEKVLPGKYTIEITNNFSTCSITRSITVADEPEPILFSESDLTIVPQELCKPDGSITVNSSILPGDETEYTFNWYDDGMNSIGNNTNVLDTISYPTLVAGTYYVEAIRLNTVVPGASCSSSLVEFELPSIGRSPSVSLSSTANTSCDPSNYSDATILIEMSTASVTGNTDIDNSDYTLEITDSPTGSGFTGVTVNTATSPYTFISTATEKVLPGKYTIEITNNFSTCSITRSITVADEPEPILFSESDLTIVPQELCKPDGSITVNSSILPGDETEYTFNWYDDGMNSIGNNTNVLDTISYPTLVAGTYYVEAIRLNTVVPGASCSSSLVEFELPSIGRSPSVSLSSTANTSCDPSNYSDATILIEMSTASVTGNTDIDNSDYTLEITDSPTGSGFTGVTVNTATSPYTFISTATEKVLPGKYTIEITNNFSTCSITRSITVADEPEPILFSESDLTIVPQELCKPDGSITVNSSILPGDETEYTFNWYDDGMNSIGNNTNVLDTISYPTLVAGTYYVEAIRLNTVVPGASCSSSLVEFELPSIGRSPSVSLSSTANTSCDPSNYSDATILIEMSTASVTGNTDIDNSDYTLEITDSPTGSGFTGVTVNTATSPYTFISTATEKVLPGKYTIEITNNFSTCSITRSITVADEPEPILFSESDLTIVPQELCKPDGSITVNSSILPGDETEYTFNWYDDGMNSIGNNTNVLDTISYPTLVAGTYYVEAIRLNTVVPGASCSSSLVEFELPSIGRSPSVSLSSTANTSCDPSNYSDATILIEMSTASVTGNTDIDNSDYTLEITDSPTGSGFTGVTVNTATSPYTFISTATEKVLPGKYTIEITNNFSTCSITRSITVADEPEPILFSESDLTIVPQELCKPDGSITVNSSILPGDETEYTFNWYDDGMNSIGNNTNVLDTISYPTLVAGTYYVEAIRLNTVVPGASCSSSLVEFELPSIGRSPSVSLSSTANTSCDPSNYSDATILIEMSTASVTGNTDIDNSDYTLEITDSPTGSGFTGVTVNTATSPYTFISTATEKVLPGKYTIEITNNFSTCSITRSITVEDNPEPIVLSSTDLSVVNATSCSPSGSISVTNISPNTPNGISDYSFIWYDGETNYNNDVPIAGVSGPVLDSTAAIYPTIHSGTYYVQAIRNTGINPGSTCISNAVRVVIEDDSENPAVLIVENAPNSSCDPANPNGSISASVPGSATSDYTFEWFIGLNNTTNAVAAANISGTSGETISGLASGNYTLRITDNTSPGESCETIESFFLSEDLTISVPRNVTFDIVPQSDCFDSGSITVTSLTPGLPADFSYEWYYDTYDASGLIPGETSAALTGRPSGTYYVRITNIATQCTLGDPIQRVIPNQSIPPSIELRDGKPNTDCDITTPDGFLEVSADLGQIAGYSFVWYEGEMPVNSGAAVIGNSNRINQLDSGYYSVVVQSSATNCSDTAQFYVDFIPELPKISLTTSPVTNCGSPNGSAYAQIYNLEGNFAFNWYIGTEVTGQPDFTGDWLMDVPAGDYVVEAIDLDAPACISEPIAFTISELIEVPQLKLNQISPNTYCDPAKVNGVAEVAIYYVDEDDVTDTVFVSSNFEVLWYRTASMPGASVEYNGRINTTLSATEYTVTYMNIATNCQWEQNIVISEDLTVIPPPEVAITELFDSCEEPNGAAEISAATQNTNYIYKWYLNEISDIAAFETTNVNTLDIGTYMVTATDTVSGCVSEPTEVAIVDNREAPIITLNLTKETCGDFNGSATITLNEGYEYRVIEWDTPDGIATGTTYEAFTAGDYAVTVIGNNGCAYTETFSIGSEINVFNGFSPNGDGVNDEWEIGCIESFNGNKVEIYNRAGALVFATENYRNAGNGFKGLGNRGLYAGNRELPDGTYFYVIIKGDGSESVTGYIEMFR